MKRLRKVKRMIEMSKLSAKNKNLSRLILIRKAIMSKKTRSLLIETCLNSRAKVLPTKRTMRMTKKVRRMAKGKEGRDRMSPK